MFNWLTFRPSRRRASSYRLVTTRFNSRRRTAMHLQAMVSIARLFFGFSMISLPASFPLLFVYAITGKVKASLQQIERDFREGREEGRLGEGLPERWIPKLAAQEPDLACVDGL